ncbi:hypothetical protein [Paenibacillus macquariensis]|uniref:Protein NO VEIN C-terminal domain-containing protein n=1 Tax=Paenibacillus macquariensis TaxID=948756 RepID=A0ABY1KDT8_9BACL|nr:hypothetical protein [Paenibacillus macquariensis]MEC0093820.1 hypothetical protein [Paenibacillus macquariensis]OAB33603.1 hypothetical protein PMSM_13320 [Paenibacillus macquariensis subsp. macquariensis]SIR67500.1 hypothetical protein SAMN05421578_13111 [Paenibacillus macquariensis]
MINVYEDQLNINQYVNNVLKQFFEMFIEFANNLEFEDIYAEAFPQHLRRDPEFCLERLEQLNGYILDDFFHNILPLDEYIIYHVLVFMDEATDLEEEIDIFTHEKDAFLAKNKKYLSEEQNDLINGLDNINDIIGFIFDDVDFLDVGLLFQHYVNNPVNFEKFFHVNLDFYVELMPNDIREKYSEIKNKVEDKSVDKISSNLEYANFDSKEEFIEVIRGTMNKFSFYVKHKKLYKLINGSEKSLSEKEFQILCGFYLEIYLKGFDLDISPEVDTGRGSLDFKISCGKKYKAVIEFKMDTNSNLNKGIEYQLPLYQHVTEVDYGVYAIVCIEDNSYNKNDYFREKATEISNKYGVLIEYFCIDARKNKESASKIKSDDEMLID